MAVEAPDSRGTCLWGDLCSPVAGLYQLLRQIHLLERRLRLGRPLCLHRGGTGDTRCRATAPALSRHFGKNDLARGMGADRSKPDDSVGIARLLVAAGNLPDGNVRASDVCDCSALQEHLRLRFGENGCLGLDHRVEYPGSVGSRAPHDVEFSAVFASPRRGSAGLGGEFGARSLACRDGSAGSGFVPVAKQLASGRVRARFNVCNSCGPMFPPLRRTYRNNSPSSRGLSIRTSGRTSSSVCGANPYVTPQVHNPALRPVKTSIDESPIIRASAAATPVSCMMVRTPTVSGFFVVKLLPP